MATKILPTPEVLRQLLRCDPETGKLFWRERPVELAASQSAANAWNARHAGKEALIYLNSVGYFQGAVLCKSVLAHRVIWAIVVGEWPNDCIDHINGIRNDNRIENLRESTHSKNARNLTLPANNTSGVIGVSWFARGKKWWAQMHINGESMHLGYHDSIEDAAAARKEAERRFGFSERHGKRSL